MHGERRERNPKPETRNPKPETRNPKLDTAAMVLGSKVRGGRGEAVVRWGGGRERKRHHAVDIRHHAVDIRHHAVDIRHHAVDIPLYVTCSKSHAVNIPLFRDRRRLSSLPLSLSCACLSPKPETLNPKSKPSLLSQTTSSATTHPHPHPHPHPHLANLPHTHTRMPTVIHIDAGTGLLFDPLPDNDQNLTPHPCATILTLNDSDTLVQRHQGSGASLA
jgi:hypothetical protein